MRLCLPSCSVASPWLWLEDTVQIWKVQLHSLMHLLLMCKVGACIQEKPVEEEFSFHAVSIVCILCILPEHLAVIYAAEGSWRQTFLAPAMLQHQAA